MPFKAYDIRGRVPDQLNEELVYAIGRAFAEIIQPGKTVIGHDIRHSSPALASALAEGLMDGGSDVYDIGLCGTEEIYFATDHFNMGGGIMVTASHNPIDYNGLKLVREGARPISGDSGLRDIEALAKKAQFTTAQRGHLQSLDARSAYIEHLLGYIDLDALKPLKVVVNPGNGGAGLVVDELESHLPFDFIKVNYEPDGNFPNGIPNPLLPENRSATAEAIKQHKADLGIAWDGDFDRCFFFDENGRFIEGYYLVGLLAQAFLEKHTGSRIVHDPRLTWNTVDVVTEAGGVPVMSKTGHAFIKERMRKEDAVYGGEMSAHHYFRDFAYCDSGMIPWLLVTELMSIENKKLSEMVDERISLFPASGEINRVVSDTEKVLAAVEQHFQQQQPLKDTTDGLSLEFDNWRLNLRASNTEPVLRLNVESRGNQELMQDKTDEILGIIKEFE